MSLLLSPTKIKVLLVPINPISQSTFVKYLSILRSFKSIHVGELTPPDSKTAKFTQDMYHDGRLYYEYITEFDKDLNQLEELALSRQIFMVAFTDIGI
jgi:Transport protein Trs120 or TRAPPC9, TRAPP II complex subunit